MTSYDGNEALSDITNMLQSPPQPAGAPPLPRIMLMGTRRSGKTSITKVVFQKMSPHETLFLEATGQLRLREIQTSALVHFQVLDFPGCYDLQQRGISPDIVFNRPGTLVFVIDAQDDENQFTEAIDYFISTVKIAIRRNPRLHIDVLIHKVDGDAYLSEDHKVDCQSEIRRLITEELAENDIDLQPTFHLTSIYDHSIFEAFSKIVQTLLPSLSFLEKLLDSLTASSQMEKAFLFDVVSKIYVATDSSPVDMQTYELCADMIDVVLDVSSIYGANDDRNILTNFDSGSSDNSSIIHLSNGYALHFREVHKYLALICLIRQDESMQQGLLEYNFAQFKDAIGQLLEVKVRAAATAMLSADGARTAKR